MEFRPGLAARAHQAKSESHQPQKSAHSYLAPLPLTCLYENQLYASVEFLLLRPMEKNPATLFQFKYAVSNDCCPWAKRNLRSF
jgi:hypothetical protein